MPNTSIVEAVSLLGGVFALLANVTIPFALFFWGRSIARRLGGRAWKLASYLPLAALAVSGVGVAFTIVGLVVSFGSVARAPAAERATRLSEGIAHAMNATAFGVGIAMLLLVGTLVAFTAGELAARRKPAS